MSWADGRLCGFDMEATSADPETARIVSVTLVSVGGGEPTDVFHLVVDPGIEIPAEYVRVNGQEASVAAKMVAQKLSAVWSAGVPVCGFNLSYDFTVLDRELRRHCGTMLTATKLIVDSHVIDRALDRRSGKRTLTETCEHYHVRLDKAHDAVEDALAATRVVWKLAKRHPTEVGDVSLDELYEQQVSWARQWATHMNEYWRSTGKNITKDGSWPILATRTGQPHMGEMSRAGLRAEAEGVLRRLVGAHAGDAARLRDDQWRAIEALVVHKQRVLCIQRTGWGKSAVYFVATALLRARGGGPTVIVSPLLALMRNQVEAAERAGIRAHTINSANLEDWSQITDEVHVGTVDVLLISPERLNNPDFRDNLLPKLAATTGLLVIDEAHCISDWGHDFRPDYRRLRSMLGELPAGVPVLATTATANERVSTDVAEQLGSQVLVLRGPLGRESLRLAVLDLPSSAHRLGWLADNLDRLRGSGIIYTLTVTAATETAEFLRSRGYAVGAYSGKAEDADRRQAELDLLDNRLKALVATSALGMGFDKPDLGFVVHLGAPPSPIAYYQQVGRAGRAVESAEVILLPGREDPAIWRYFASLAFPPEEQVRRVLQVLAQAGQPLSTAGLEPLVDLRRGRLEMMLKVLDVDGAVRRVRGGWTSTGQPWTYDTARLARVATARQAEQDAMMAYAATPGCRMLFLREALDDPEAAACGRCDRCAHPRLDAFVSEPGLAAATTFLHRAGVSVEPRRQWPSGLGAIGIDLSGRIPADEQAGAGRAIGRLSDLGWGPRLRALLTETASDTELPDDVFDALIEVLKDWARGDDPWPARPVGIVAAGSRRRPQLVGSMAQRIAQVGRLPLLGAFTPVGEVSPVAGGNSAQRLRAVHASFRLGSQLAAGLSGVDGPVLLVDDMIDSGWTATLLARELRRAGVAAVYPLVLALAG